LPGTYRLRAEPRREEFGVVELDIVVKGDAESQAGPTIELPSRLSVTGQVKSFSGESVSGIPVWGRAVSSALTFNVLELAQGAGTVAPVASQVSTNSSGRFNLFADSGVYHFAARPHSASNYAWKILSSVEVAEGNVDLGRVTLPLPVVIRGSLTSDDTDSGEVPGALIQAYAYIKEGELAESPEEADALVAVGETRAGSQGEFRLLLPSVFQ
jgi:hypothetical protein